MAETTKLSHLPEAVHRLYQEIFSPLVDGAPRQKQYPSMAGTALAVWLTPNSVRIADCQDPNLHFISRVVAPGVVNIEAQTRGYSRNPEQHHPALYASVLTELALLFLAQQGHCISTIFNLWLETDSEEIPSKNYQQFKAGYPAQLWQDGQDLAQVEPAKQAAFSTWTGVEADRLRFLMLKTLLPTFNQDTNLWSIAVAFEKR